MVGAARESVGLVFLTLDVLNLELGKKRPDLLDPARHAGVVVRALLRDQVAQVFVVGEERRAVGAINEKAERAQRLDNRKKLLVADRPIQLGATQLARVKSDGAEVAVVAL